MRTRLLRVGWLGIGVIGIVCSAASAGPSFVRFDESEPVASTPIVKISDSRLLHAVSGVESLQSPSLAELEELPTVWHALPELQSAPSPVENAMVASAEFRAQPLSVPLQFGWLGVLAFTTVGSYFGARWVGIRRNHSR